MNIWEIIFLFFGFQTFLLSLIFFLKKKGNRYANNLLGYYLLLFSLNVVYNVLFWSKLLYIENFVHFSFINVVIWSLYGPILFLYVRNVVYGEKFKLIEIIHFIPTIFFVANFFSFFILTTENKLRVLKTNVLKDYVLVLTPYPERIINVLMIFYGLYLLFVVSSTIKSRNISLWLKWLSFSYLGYVLAFTAYFVLQDIGLIEIGYDYFIGYIMIFFVAMLSYFSFLQPEIFDGLPIEKLLPFKKYQKTGLSDYHSKELKTRLVDIMYKKKPFLDSGIRLDDLANELRLSRHHMSQIINEHFDLNFFDFINNYRIEEAKKLLKNDNLNITDVLYYSGFNNRVSFFKAFKKFTGTSPAKYRKNIIKC